MRGNMYVCVCVCVCVRSAIDVNARVGVQATNRDPPLLSHLFPLTSYPP